MRVKPGLTIMSVNLSKEFRLKCVRSLNETEELDVIYHSDLSVCDYQCGNDPFKPVAGLFV